MADDIVKDILVTLHTITDREPVHRSVPSSFIQAVEPIVRKVGSIAGSRRFLGTGIPAGLTGWGLLQHI